jgi:hypothetical protein
MNDLRYIREYYMVEAYLGQRIRYGKEKPVEGVILGGRNGRLRVRLDGGKKPVLLHPTWEVTYLLANVKVRDAAVDKRDGRL